MSINAISVYHQYMAGKQDIGNIKKDYIADEDEFFKKFGISEANEVYKLSPSDIVTATANIQTYAEADSAVKKNINYLTLILK